MLHQHGLRVHHCLRRHLVRQVRMCRGQVLVQRACHRRAVGADDRHHAARAHVHGDRHGSRMDVWDHHMAGCLLLNPGHHWQNCYTRGQRLHAMRNRLSLDKMHHRRPHLHRPCRTCLCRRLSRQITRLRRGMRHIHQRYNCS